MTFFLFCLLVSDSGNRVLYPRSRSHPGRAANLPRSSCRCKIPACSGTAGPDRHCPPGTRQYLGRGIWTHRITVTGLPVVISSPSNRLKLLRG